MDVLFPAVSGMEILKCYQINSAYDLNTQIDYFKKYLFYDEFIQVLQKLKSSRHNEIAIIIAMNRHIDHRGAATINLLQNELNIIDQWLEEALFQALPFNDE